MSLQTGQPQVKKAETQGEGAEAMESQQWPAGPWKQGERMAQVLPHSPQQEPALPAPQTRTSSLQDCETTHFCSLSPPAVVICYSRPSKQTKTEANFLHKHPQEAGEPAASGIWNWG